MRATEVRVGRNFIRAGDTVRVRPSAPGRRDGYLARFQHAELDDAGNVRWVEVVGGPRGRHATRSLRLDRIERVAQTKHGERIR